MRIISLELENIKSYRGSTLIHFEEGINAVCGLNGSGKTTVLEAIGLALFNFLPYSLSAFVREGEKSGTVRVRLMDHDGRTYEIVRRVGGSSTYYVVDVETGTRLADQREDVLRWVGSEALDIEGQVDLRSLFENAVGVPQGRMTADFLSSATTRKGTFDGLLRVEEYRDAFEQLRDTVSYLRDLTATVEQQIAVLRQQTDTLPDQEAECAELDTQVRAGEKHLAQLQQQEHEARVQKQRFDEIEACLHEQRSALQRVEYESKSHAALVRDLETQLERALTAVQCVTDAESGYRQVQAAKTRIEELEPKRIDRDALREALGQTTGKMDGTQRQIDRLADELGHAVADRAAAAALQDLVARQSALEASITDGQGRLREVPQIESQIERLNRHVFELERQVEELSKRRQSSEEAAREAERLGEVQSRLRAAETDLAALAPLKIRAAELKAEGTELRQLHDRLTDASRERAVLCAQLAQLEPDVARLPEVRARLDALRDQHSRTIATVEYQHVAHADLGRRHCPLLELQCPVVTANPAIVERFARQAGLLSGDLERLNRELAAAGEELTRVEGTVAEVQRLSVAAAQLEHSAEQLEQVKPQLKRCRDQYRELQEIVGREPALQQTCAALRQDELRLLQARDTAGLLGEITQQSVAARQRLAEVCEERSALQAQRSELETVERTLLQQRDELRRMNDPRTNQQRLAASGERCAALEEDLTKERAVLSDQRATNDLLEQQLRPFARLDAELEEQRSIERANQTAYEMYLKHRAEAEQLQERESALSRAREALSIASDRELRARHEYEKTDATYRPDEHQQLRVQCDAVGRDQAAERVLQDRRVRDFERISEHLEYLRRLEGNLRKQEEERETLGRIGHAVNFFRETIKSAGPAVTETLLANISQGANDIFAEIMDDHAAELRWDRDYEVVVQRGAEVRKFAQLSGGEQMSAALSVRLALLKEMSEVGFAFFDEPTQNMDVERRSNLAGQIRQIQGFNQLIVISHDDTFEHQTDHLIRLRKVHEETQLDNG